MNRLAAIVVAVAVVVGPPLLATAWAVQHRWGWLTRTQLEAWRQQPLTAGTILTGLAVIAGLGWLLLAAYVIQEATRTIAAWARRLRRMPLPAPAQMTAGSMAGVAALALPGIAVGPLDTGPSPAGTGQPQPGGAGNPTSTGPLAQARTPAGIDLPGGGWIPYRTAAAITALGSLIWLHRRQHYHSGTPRPGQHWHDTDLQPLPATAQTITAAIGAAPASASSAGARAPLDELPVGILTLHGPGAEHAARGLLVTAMLRTALDGIPAMQVTLRRQDLLLLLPAVELGDPAPVGLHLSDDPDAVLHALHRSDPSADTALWNPVLILTRSAPQRHGPRQKAASHPDLATVVVVADQASAGTSWHVDADGTTTGRDLPDGRRLCVLDTGATADLIRLVRQSTSRSDYQGASGDNPRAGIDSMTTPPTPTAGAAARPPARLVLLGGCRLTIGGKPVRLRRSAALQILAYLAVHPDGATTTELVHVVWPGLAAAAITHRLHTTLTDLRRQLHPLIGGDPVTRADDRYRLNPDAIDTDLEPLRHATATAAGALTDQQRQAAYQNVIDHYPGELAAGHTWPWLQPAREAIRRDVIDAYLHLATTATRARAAELLQDAIAVDPYNRQLHHHAVQALHALGEHTNAGALDRAYTQRLSRAGLPPDSEDPP